MRILSIAILSTFALTFGAMADETKCQTDILQGSPAYADAATGAPILYDPLPLIATTGVYPDDVTFDLGGTSYQPAPPPTYPAAPSYPEPPVMPPVATPSDFLNGTSWALVQLFGRQIQSSATLTFSADGSIGGRAACNAYGGNFVAFTNFKINISQTFATRAACPELQEEQAYFRALGEATDFRPGREGDTLALLNASGAVVALFERPGANPFPPSGSITGQWNVAGVVVNGVLETDSGFGMPSFEFRNDGQFIGNLGCNTATGPYRANGLDLSFGPIAVTARQCIVPAPFEGPIIDALPRITGLRNTPQGVSLVDLNGMELIRLVR